MGDTKYTLGGMMGSKIQAKPFESVDASVVFTIETTGSLTDEKLASMEEKVNNILKKQLKKRMQEAFDLYKNELLQIKEKAGF